MAEFTKAAEGILLKLKKDKKALFTVVIGITGMLLILLSELPAFSSEAGQTEKDNTSAYHEDLEKRVEALLSEIEGAGKVSVLLSYDTSEETIWAKDKKERIDNEGNIDTDEKYIIIDDSDKENGLALRVIYPKVRGVAVVCSGGSNPQVKADMKSVLSALFDIGSNKISIAPRAEKE